MRPIVCILSKSGSAEGKKYQMDEENGHYYWRQNTKGSFRIWLLH